jgi:hypothetical protein
MYLKGQGVPQDDAEAVKWFRRAAELGNAPAQYSLGSMYEKGRGVPQDLISAYMWLSLSVAAGPQYAQRALDTIAGRMTPEQITKAQKLAHEWKPKRASAIEESKSAPQDDAEAQKQRSPADQEDVVAQDKLGVMSPVSARGPLLSDNSFLQWVAAAKSIAEASNKQQLTPLLFLCAVRLLRDKKTGFEVSLTAENENVVQSEAEKQGIKLVGVDIEASDQKMPLSDDLREILRSNLNSSISTFLAALLASVLRQD